MCNVKWVGTPAGYTRSRVKRKRTDRWMIGTSVRGASRDQTDAGYWLGVLGIFTACAVLMAWAALISV